MTRRRAIAYGAVTAVEITYVLWTNLPAMWPSQPCGRPGIYDVCAFVTPALPWPWVALAGLLLLSAIAILLRRKAGIAMGFAGQTLLAIPFLRDMVRDVGSMLFTGSIFSGIDPDFRNLAFVVTALSVAIGPALATLLLMATPSTVTNRTAARVATVLVIVQLVVMVAVALLVFRATYQDCLNNGPGTPVIDGVPGCPDYADLDIGSLVATVALSAAIMTTVCVGLWRCRPWAMVGGFVWQVLLAAVLVAMGLGLSSDPNQNAWYDHFPAWSSPRDLAYALLAVVSAPALAALLAAVRSDFVLALRASRTS